MKPHIRIQRIMALNLSNNSRHVLHVLAAHANHNDECWPSIQTISVKTGLSRRAVDYAIAELKETGHLIAKRRQTQSSLYKLHLPDPKLTQGVRDRNAPGAYRTYQEHARQIPAGNRPAEKPGKMQCQKCQRITHDLFTGQLCRSCFRIANPTVAVMGK